MDNKKSRLAIMEAMMKAALYRLEAEQTNDAKAIFLALGYSMEVERLIGKAA